MTNKPIFIGIAGGTGSGKTTMVNKLREGLGNRVLTLCHDYYYKAHSELTLDERKKLNYDHPNAFDTEMMVADIERLREGKTIQRPIYDFVQHTRAEGTIEMEPTKVIIVEGILIFESKALRELLDIKVFIDADADVRIVRRLVRDVKQRGRDFDSVVDQYLTTVKPMHEEFIEPSKRYADLIIPGGGYNQVALKMLLDKINLLLDK